MRRAIALGLLLFGIYAATIGLDAFGRADYAGDEPHYLLAAQSIVDDHDVDLKNQFAMKSYSAFYPYELDRHGTETDGSLYEIHGIGFPLLIAPAYAIGGAVGVELFLAAISALCLMLAYRLALRVVPDPWAFGAALAVAISPPMLAYATAVYPEMAAALVLVAAALLALRLDEHVSRRMAFGCFALLGALPWLGTRFILVGAVIGLYAVRSLLRAHRRTLALGATEVAFFSVALYVGLNEALYNGPTPYSADFAGENATNARGIGGYLNRSYRLVALWIDRDNGLLRWAPVFALMFVGLWMTYRSRRDHLSRAVPQLRATERAATMCAAAVGTQIAVAAFLAPTMFGFWFPPRHLLAGLPLAIPLVAIGLRKLPRTGTVLAAVTAATSVWLYLAVRLGSDGLVTPRPDAPLGPLTALLPSFGEGEVWPFALAGAIGAALLGLAALEVRHWRQTAGATRAGHSG
ncbi:MAG: hypothetical protein ACR2HC_08570 [Thermoleophilaceae bacterium]